MTTKTASSTPVKDIELITRINNPNQNPSLRMYREGYEPFFEQLPILNPLDKFLQYKVDLTKGILEGLATKITKDNWVRDQNPGDNKFARTIVAIEHPQRIHNELHEGTELVVAHWGKGFTSPIHGHSVGYMHEAILDGKVLVNTYRMINRTSDRVRLVETQIVSRGTFVSNYSDTRETYAFPRPILIHNFVALESTNSLHYLPEHTRDGKDNGFVPEYFEDQYQLTPENVTKITGYQGLSLRVGDVALVRSENVSEYGDHYIVITGPNVMKEHGLRPQERAIAAPHVSRLLNQFDKSMGLTLLLLDDRSKIAFHEFHGIEINNGKVIFPEPTPLAV